jgi:hypothetical protein
MHPEDFNQPDWIEFHSEEEELIAKASIMNVYPEFFENDKVFKSDATFAELLNRAEITPEELETVMNEAEKISFEGVVKSEFVKYTPELIAIREKLRKVLDA